MKPNAFMRMVAILLASCLAAEPVGAGFHPRPQSEFNFIQSIDISGSRPVWRQPLQFPFASQALSSQSVEFAPISDERPRFNVIEGAADQFLRRRPAMSSGRSRKADGGKPPKPRKPTAHRSDLLKSLDPAILPSFRILAAGARSNHEMSFTDFYALHGTLGEHETWELVSKFDKAGLILVDKRKGTDYLVLTRRGVELQKELGHASGAVPLQQQLMDVMRRTHLDSTSFARACVALAGFQTNFYPTLCGFLKGGSYALQLDTQVRLQELLETPDFVRRLKALVAQSNRAASPANKRKPPIMTSDESPPEPSKSAQLSSEADDPEDFNRYLTFLKRLGFVREADLLGHRFFQRVAPIFRTSHNRMVTRYCAWVTSEETSEALAHIFTRYSAERARQLGELKNGRSDAYLNAVANWITERYRVVPRIESGRLCFQLGAGLPEERRILLEVIDSKDEDPGDAHYFRMPDFKKPDGRTVPVFLIQLQARAIDADRLENVLGAHEFPETAWRTLDYIEPDADRRVRQNVTSMHAQKKPVQGPLPGRYSPGMDHPAPPSAGPASAPAGSVLHPGDTNGRAGPAKVATPRRSPAREIKLPATRPLAPLALRADANPVTSDVTGRNNLAGASQASKLREAYFPIFERCGLDYVASVLGLSIMQLAPLRSRRPIPLTLYFAAQDALRLLGNTKSPLERSKELRAQIQQAYRECNKAITDVLEWRFKKRLDAMRKSRGSFRDTDIRALERIFSPPSGRRQSRARRAA